MSSMVLQIIVSGILWGFVFALIALGLTLIFGVMDIVNFAHGEFLMVAMYAAFWFSVWPGVDPLVSLPAVAIILGLLGFVVYWALIRHVLKAPMLAQIFSTFGLMIFLQGTAQVLWSPSYRAVADPLFHGSWKLAQVDFSKPQLVAAAGAVIATAAVFLFMHRTRIGWALQAVSQDKQAAALMGIPVQRAFALAWVIGAAMVGIAGALLAEFYYIFPTVGAYFAPIAFAAVALGGFGSIQGAFVAGIIMGIVQVVGSFFISSALAPALIFLVYLVVTAVRPQGLMGRK